MRNPFHQINCISNDNSSPHLAAGLRAVRPLPAVSAINRFEAAAEALRHVPIADLLHPENSRYFIHAMSRFGEFCELVKFAALEKARI